jgi:hypothetical protein
MMQAFPFSRTRPVRALALSDWAALACAVASAVAMAGCMAGGNSGSETTNGLAGVVKDVEGRPVARARVLLLKEDSDPASRDSKDGKPAPETVTDGKGRYRLEDLIPGRYNLEWSDGGGERMSLRQGVEVPAEGVATVDGTLGKPGAVSVRIADFVGPGDSGYAYIPGTTSWARVDSAARAAGTLALRPVPVGRFPALILAVESAAGRRLLTLAEDFEVFAESTASIPPFQSWKHSRDLALDAPAMGVKGAVTDFPWLIRLDAGGFDFAQAEADGRDLRVTDAEGDPVPFRIERWDAGAGRAEVWALLDTVRSGSPTRLTLHWGRGLTAPQPPGPEVFEAAAGFATVYHLDEAGNTDPGGYKDAGSNRNHATAASINAGARVDGVIAGAKVFAGAPLSTTGVLTAAMPPGFSGDCSYTVSFWIRFGMTATRQTVLDFGGFSAPLHDVHFLIRADTLSQFGAYDANRSSGTDPAGWQNVTSLAPYVGTWTYVTVAYDASRKTIATYLNGVEADEDPTSPLAIDPADGLRIGQALATHPGDSPFNGALDEVRFCTRVLSADRIRLDYETQKP